MGSKNAAVKHGNSKSKNAGTKKGQKAKPAEVEREPLLDYGMRVDLIGIGLAIIGIVLFVAVVAPGNAVLSVAISSGLLHLFGKGAYVVPFAFVIWGGSFFVKSPQVRIWRLVVGLAIIIWMFMALLSLWSPLTLDTDVYSLFNEQTLVEGGGYLGSALAWLFMMLLGRVIATIILIGGLIAGAILIGFSISGLITFVKNFIALGRGEATDEDEFEPGVQKAYQQSFDEYDDMTLPQGEGDTTIQLGNKRRKKGGASKKAADTVMLDPAEDTVAIDSADETIALDGKSKRGATVTKPARKAKDTAATNTPSPSPTSDFVLPPRQLLKTSGKRKGTSISELRETAQLLSDTLADFGLEIEVVGWQVGPTVTLFKVSLPSGVKLAKLVGLQDDIALALAASSVRIAQVPSTSLVGIEIPNRSRSTVTFGDGISHVEGGPTMMEIGEDVDGNNIAVDLARMPHLLVAGATGSGKSVAMNSMIMTMLMRATPSEVRMIMIDPKRVEFSFYNGIPHLYVPVVTEPKEAASALRWAVVEMERRLKVFEQCKAKNIGSLNKMIQQGKLDDEEGESMDEMPFIVVVIDELADLMMVAGKDVEDSICRIAQLGRAAGIHLIVATQRPSTNVITGMIKANIVNRVALSVSNSVDSRVILDTSGAEKLVGHGDMLFSNQEWGKPKRIQGSFITDPEIEAVVEHLKEQSTPDYHLEILRQAVDTSSKSGASGAAVGGEDDDALLWEAAELIVSSQKGSTSNIQRRLKVGYARAGRIMDMLEEKGIVGPQDGSRARDVLVESVEDLETMRAFDENDEEGGY